MGRLTATARAEIWGRRQRGEVQQAIARALGVSHVTIHKTLQRTGGIAPPPRRRAPRVLRTGEREEISRGLAAGQSLRSLADQLGRAPSTISREVGRHGGRRTYRAGAADAAAWRRARRPKRCWLARQPRLRRVVSRLLTRAWSPEQIAAWLRRTYPDTAAMQVSHETIYRTLYVQSRGVFKRELLRYLRRPRPRRRPRVATVGATGPLAEAVSIAARPATVEARAVPGHWEGDLLTGTIHSQIATLVERQSRYVMLVRLPTKEAPQWPARSRATCARCRRPCAARSRGIAVASWPRTARSRWPPTSRCISVIRTARGNAGRTKTPMACYASHFPAAPISQRFPKPKMHFASDMAP